MTVKTLVLLSNIPVDTLTSARPPPYLWESSGQVDWSESF